jgi:hypothetical protein
MSDNCHAFRDLLAAETLHELAATDRESLARHLQDCVECREFQRALQEDDRRLSAFVSATERLLGGLERRINEEIARSTPAPARRKRPRRRFATPGRRRLAVAAVVAACVVLGVNILDRDGGGGGVVWADVWPRVEEARSYICRRIEKRSGEPAQEIVEYRSAVYGLRQDIYQEGKLQAVQYIVPADRMLYALVHRDRTYLRQRLSDDQVAEMQRQSDAQEIVRSFREYEHRSLGRRRIDGKMAEGIEISNPQEWVAVFEGGSWRLWVDTATQWPIRIELEGIARGGSVRKTYTLKDFQWNPALSARDFAVEIPVGYKLIADLDEVEANEKGAIVGLRAYAGLLGGRYPSSLSFATAIAEAERLLDAKHDRYDERAGKDLASLFEVRSACNFYRDLLDADKDAAYYGDGVSARDFGRVLLRWRLDDGRYRVIYGDLRAETVSVDRLAELERPR